MAGPPDDIDAFLAERNAVIMSALASLSRLPLPAPSALPAPADPVVGLYRDWRHCSETMDALGSRRDGDRATDRAFERIFRRSWAVECALVETGAVTFAGVVAKLRVFACQRVAAPWDNDLDTLLVLSALLDLEKLAGALPPRG